MTLEEGAQAKTGGHTQFKNKLRADLHKRMGVTMKQRVGPSFDERVDRAVKAFNAKARAVEADQRKSLNSAVERGRSRPTSAPIRPRSEGPDQAAMLQERMQRMKELEESYVAELDRLRHKMDTREPLFRLSEVQDAIEMQQRRRLERKRELAEEERLRWEHLRAVEENACNRPLLLEDGGAKRAIGSSTTPAPPAATDPSGGEEFSGGSRPHSASSVRAVYEIDKRINEAVSRRSFEESDWAKEVKKLKEKMDNRQRLHEIQYPVKRGRMGLSRALLMHRSVGSLQGELIRIPC